MEGQDNVEYVTAGHSPVSSRPVAEADGWKSMATSTPNGIRSSPPVIFKHDAMDKNPSDALPEESGVKSDSEAETIVLPGKDGYSPSKIRKSIKHEDKSDGEGPDLYEPDVGSVDSGEFAKNLGLENGSESAVATSTLGKRKRVKHGNNKNDPANLTNSSTGLSSAPTSPVATTRSSLSKPAASDSDISRSPSPRSPHSTARDKAKSVDRVLQRRRQYASGSGDEGEPRKFGRQRSSGAEHTQSREKDNRGPSKQNNESHSRKRTRSISPLPRSHSRSISAQLPAKATHGLSHKKKRIPAPLQSTEYQSDDSSASGNSSRPRSSRFRQLAAPISGESNISPAKMAPHKKQVDYSGQTWLAKACAKGKLEMVKQRLEERPGDLDVGDHAKNTPLHIASIDGYAEVVKLLLDSGCVVDPINEAKDTPLHDAIENGHVEVVKLLLDAGANPQKANSKGEDPYDLIDRVDDHNVAEEMREAIIAAKEKSSGLRKSSEDEETPDLDSHMSHVSPRQTPPAHENQFFGSTSRRNAGTRAVKTSDRILYQRLDSSELRKAAASNDVESIARILEVHSNHLDDPRSLIIAAKAGHHEVVNLMFGLGGFHPDPDPLKDMGESATPILAAIGRGNLKVIELLLNQPNFDPTRLIDGATYYEISKRRGGHFWIEEEAMLRKAFEKYKAEHPSSPKKPRSPGLRRDGRDVDRDTRRQKQREESEASRSHKRTTSSPKIKESEPSKTQPKSANPASQSKDSQSNTKRGPGRPKKDEGAISEAMSDDENTPLGPPRQKLHVKRSESDVAVASESETASKPRRKLVSGKEFRGERELEKQRRASITSNASNASVKDRRESENMADRLGRKASPNLRRSSKSGHTDHDLTSENPYSDKEKDRSIKRDVSKDRLTAIREQSPTKRPRTSATPPRSSLHEVSGHDSGEVPQKRRKLEGDSKSVRKTEGASSSSPDHRTSTSTTKAIHDNTSTKSSSDTKDKARSNHKLLNSTDSSRHASEEGSRKQAETTARPSKSKVDNDVRMEEAKAASAVKAKADLEAQNRREKEEQEIKERAEKDAREKRLEEERIEELARQDRLAKELAEREEEAKRQQESERKERQQEAERKERQRKEDEEARLREQERQKQIYQEQEKVKRQELERRRSQKIEQEKAEKIRIEKEKREKRLSKLPLLLRWFDQDDNPKTPEKATLFRCIEGYRYDTIRPETTGNDNARDSWMLNTHAALLLGEKDLQLTRYTSWDHIALSRNNKEAIWQFENPFYSVTDTKLAPLRRQLPDIKEKGRKLVEQNKALFLDLDLFFVKVSDFMFVLETTPAHLKGLELVVKYRELKKYPHSFPVEPEKWEQNPDRDPKQTSVPRPKYYVNGKLTRPGSIPTSRTSKTSFGERRVPRRGLVQVFPGEPDYEQLAREQGLSHLISNGNPPHPQSNGTHAQVNGITPPNSATSRSVNGGSPSLEMPPLLHNGIHDDDTVMGNTTVHSP